MLGLKLNHVSKKGHSKKAVTVLKIGEGSASLSWSGNDDVRI